MKHFVKKCNICGTIVAQCRCPSNDKVIEYVHCDSCLKKIAVKDCDLKGGPTKATAIG